MTVNYHIFRLSHYTPIVLYIHGCFTYVNTKLQVVSRSFSVFNSASHAVHKWTEIQQLIFMSSMKPVEYAATENMQMHICYCERDNAILQF